MLGRDGCVGHGRAASGTADELRECGSASRGQMIRCREGRAGSYYAVRDYYDVSPDYAEDPARRMDEFDALVERVHAADMRVMIDLVPNHVARSYASVVHPERDFGRSDDQSVFFTPSNQFFYLQDPKGRALSLARPVAGTTGVTFDGAFAREDETPATSRVPRATTRASFTALANDWYETGSSTTVGFTARVGVYEPVPATWSRSIRPRVWQEHGVDGFRCDFAHYVPNEAWRYLISRARTRDANGFFFAEAYENLSGLLGAGFDAVYPTRYDTMKGIYLGQRSQRISIRSLARSMMKPRPYLHYPREPR